MTVAHDISTPAPKDGRRELRAGRRLEVRWMVDRSALARARPGLLPGGGDAPAGGSPADRPVELRWLMSLDGGSIRASAAIVDPAERRNGGGVRVTPLLESRSEMMRPEPVWLDDGRMVHVDLPGLLMVSLRRERDGMRLLYARTRVLEESLGLPGGRYEPVSASDVS